MPIAVKCSECGKQYRLKDAFAGKLIACKECDTKIHVPRPGQPKKKPPVKKKQAEVDPWDDEDDDDDELDSSGSSSAESNPWDDDDDDDDELGEIPQPKPRKSAQEASAKKSKKGDGKKSKKGDGKKKKKGKEKEPEKSKLPLLLGIGGGVLLLLIGGGVLTWFLLSGDSAPVYDIDTLPEWKRVSIAGEDVSILMPGVAQVDKAFDEPNGGKSHQFFVPLKDNPNKGYFWELSFQPLPNGVKVESSEFFDTQLAQLIKSLDKNKPVKIGDSKGVLIQFTKDEAVASIWAFPTKKGVVVASYIEPTSSKKDDIRKKFLTSLEINGKKLDLKEGDLKNF